MIARLLAWAIALGLCWGGYTFVQNWKNPWSAASTSAVLDNLPPLPAGCGEGCKP